ncbi:MAG: ComF family protein [Desulfobacterales bacterium]|nr:ComF family protein [Desulfobacterales bacterium]
MNRILAGFWPGVGRAISNTLWPPRCYACGCSIARMTAMRVGAGESPAGYARPGPGTIFEPYLCPACTGSVMIVKPPLCICCGKMFMSRQGPDHLCGQCSRRSWHFDMARSAAVFDRCLTTLVHRYKYSSQTGLAQPLGMLMRAVLLDNWDLADIDCVVPIPLHRQRLRARGFNQSLLLAQSLVPPPEACPDPGRGLSVTRDLLERTRSTATQTGLGPKARTANVKNAFRVRPGKGVANLRLLVVDDVFTTGATVNECARILMEAGAKRVDVLTLARTHTESGKLNHG